MKKKHFLIYQLLLMGVLIVFANSCEKDDDDNGNTGDIPVLTTTAITNRTQTTAISGGDITDDGGTAVTVRGVCWSTNESPTIDDNITEDGTGAGNFMSSIADLEPSTKYYLRAYATNSIGTGYGNIITFHTFGSFTDPRDGNTYKTIVIGNQTWMAENLKYYSTGHQYCGTYNSGYIDPCFYVYGYNGTNVNEAILKDNYNTYGVLYSWVAAMNGASGSFLNPSGVQGVCPEGWHLPSDAEWDELINYIGGKQYSATKLKAIGNVNDGTGLWASSHYITATNETGFSALPGGIKTGTGFNFSDIQLEGGWWTSTDSVGVQFSSQAIARRMSYISNDVQRQYWSRGWGLSVRCIKN